MRKIARSRGRVAALALLLAPALFASASAPAADAGKAPDAADTEKTAGAAAAKPEPHYGFDVSDASLPADEIVPGGPGRDGIKSVDDPELVAPEEASWVAGDTPVLGVELDGEAHAYPVHIIEYHQVVNDVLGGKPVAVSYDPLVGTPRAFLRSVEGRPLRFGVSGLIYNSNFLMFDRETESLWLQYTGEAISGPMKGKKLAPIRIRQEPTELWLSRRPDSKVLTRPMLKRINYRYSRYQEYWVRDEIPFPVKAEDRRYHAKELVVGVEVDGKARAYLGSILTAMGGVIEDEFQGRTIRIAYDTNLGLFSWAVPDDVRVTEAYWFGWKAFNPDTEIWQDLHEPTEP